MWIAVFWSLRRELRGKDWFFRISFTHSPSVEQIFVWICSYTPVLNGCGGKVREKKVLTSTSQKTVFRDIKYILKYSGYLFFYLSKSIGYYLLNFFFQKRDILLFSSRWILTRWLPLECTCTFNVITDNFNNKLRLTKFLITFNKLLYIIGASLTVIFLSH